MLLARRANGSEQRSIAPGQDRHVVVVVWDGMRPDFVTERNTPTLWKLAREGVIFRNHHSIYPTATDINGAAIATGVYPNRNGLLANREYRPRIDPLRAFENAAPEIIKKADETSNGKYLAAPTVPEILRAAGRRTAIVGTKSVSLLFDRFADWTTAFSKNSLVRFAAAPMPASVANEMLRRLGPFLTDPTSTSDQRNTYATRALTEILWRDGLPELSFLWLSDPDLTQHDYSPGAKQSMAAVQSSDRNLARVLSALSRKNARATTDLFIVSDHGFSTIERAIDFPSLLRDSGFDAVVAFDQSPRPKQIMVVENGGTILFYVVNHDREVTSRLIEWIQQSDFAGVIFAREKFKGTFPLESVRVNTGDAPDVVVALRWSPTPNRFGVAGQIITDAARRAGEGSHATLSEFDVHNTLIAAGPRFRRGLRNDLPSGNIDLAPTILQLLGLQSQDELDGRVLVEAMTGDSKPQQAITETMEVSRAFPNGEWRQHLRVSRVGDTIYFDEGNGTFATQPPTSSLDR